MNTKAQAGIGAIGGAIVALIVLLILLEVFVLGVTPYVDEPILEMLNESLN